MRQDEYEHVASTFFDKKKNRLRKKHLIFYTLAFILVFLITVSVGLFSTSNKNFSQSLFISPDKLPLVIAYDFSIPGKSKIRSVSFDLENSDVSRYSNVAFLIRSGEKFRIDSSIRIQIENNIHEKDSQFVSGVNNRWQRYELPLAAFEQINDWTAVQSLTFIIDEWNVSSKKGAIYIDEVRFFE